MLFSSVGLADNARLEQAACEVEQSWLCLRSWVASSRCVDVDDVHLAEMREWMMFNLATRGDGAKHTSISGVWGTLSRLFHAGHDHAGFDETLHSGYLARISALRIQFAIRARFF